MLLPLLVGISVLLVSLLLYGMATGLIVQLVVLLIRKKYVEISFWKNIAIMMIISLVTALAHLIQIALWALAIFMCGATETFETAIYWSAQNYTALGYGDVGMSERWRLLGPLEAVNGLLLFGLSTSLMFAILSRLITNRLHYEFGTSAAADSDSR
jgi:hypothetical protein